LPEIDALAAHRHVLSKQSRPLRRAPRQTTVGSDDSMPGEIVGRGEDVSDKPRRVGIDIAVGAHISLRNRADPLDNLCPSCITARRVDAIRAR
jgi:hypothetical protein